jgi:hypothetical protein
MYAALQTLVRTHRPTVGRMRIRLMTNRSYAARVPTGRSVPEGTLIMHIQASSRGPGLRRFVRAVARLGGSAAGLVLLTSCNRFDPPRKVARVAVLGRCHCSVRTCLLGGRHDLRPASPPSARAHLLGSIGAAATSSRSKAGRSPPSINASFAVRACAVHACCSRGQA